MFPERSPYRLCSPRRRVHVVWRGGWLDRPYSGQGVERGRRRVWAGHPWLALSDDTLSHTSSTRRRHSCASNGTHRSHSSEPLPQLTTILNNADISHWHVSFPISIMATPAAVLHLITFALYCNHVDCLKIARQLCHRMDSREAPWARRVRAVSGEAVRLGANTFLIFFGMSMWTSVDNRMLSGEAMATQGIWRAAVSEALFGVKFLGAIYLCYY